MKFELKAGKMIYDKETGKVKPDGRKGKLQILSEEGAKVLRWVDIQTNTPEETFYIFPASAIFEKVKQIKGRIYLFKVKSSDERYFFWLQVSEN